MGSYGIGVTRTIQAAVEKYNDARGIIWPAPLAPYHVHIVPLSIDESLRNAAFTLHDQLIKAGVETILDDRDERAGVKLNDADLVGMPLRVNIGAKSFEKGQFELKDRSKPDLQMVEIGAAVETIKKQVEAKLATPVPI